MNGYWPWWAGAVGLAVTTINYTVTTDRSFGVSSAWERVVHWRTERRVERLNARVADERVLADALVAATAEQFGTATAGTATAVFAPGHAAHDDAQPSGRDIRLTADARGPVPTLLPGPLANLLPAPLVSQAGLLLSIFLGGWVAAVTSGRFDLRLDMGDGFRQIVTGNPIAMVAVLFVGGVLVGFGTRLAGGCSSGHGLSGCGRLQPVSLLATAVFFGTAVVVSFLLWKVI